MIENENKNYYEILGVRRETSQEAIRHAYLRMAKLLTANNFGNPPNSQLVELNHIYEVLSNPQKKMEYDVRFIKMGGYDFTKPRSNNTQKGQPPKQASTADTFLKLNTKMHRRTADYYRGNYFVCCFVLFAFIHGIP